MSSAKQSIEIPKNHSPRRSQCFFRISGYLVLLWMAGMLVLYFAVHSPLREVIASKIGLASRGCFFCTYSYSLEAFIDTVSALFLIFMALIAAWITTRYWLVSKYEKLIYFIVICLALLVVPASMIGEISSLLGKGYLRPPFGPLLASIPAACILLLGLIKGWRPQLLVPKMEKKSFLITIISIFAILILVISVVISLLHPPSGYDALGYHGPMASFLWHDGNIETYLDRSPSYWALAHPGTAELWIGLLLIAGGETLGKLGQIPFILLGCASIYAFSRRLGLMRGAAQLAAVTFMFVPIVIVQSGMLLNDLIGSGLLMASFVLVLAPIEEWNYPRCILFGLSLGLVATTKLALLPAAGFIGLYALYHMWKNRKSIKRQKAIVWLILILIVFFIVVAPWWLRNTIRFGNPIFPVSLPFIGRGFSFSSSLSADLAFVPRQAAWIIYPFIEIHDDQSGFGLLFLVFSLIGFFYAAAKSTKRPIILFAILSIVMVLSWWFFSEHFPRFLLPSIGLACAFIPWSLLSIPRPQRRIGYTLLVIASAFSILVTMNQALLPFAKQPVTRIEFYDQVWGVDPIVQALPETEGILYQTGYAPGISEYAAYYPLLGNSLDRLVLPTDQESNTNSIIDLMRKNKIQYAYVCASPENRELMKALFDPKYFELVNLSMVVKGDPTGPRRSLIRPATVNEEDVATWRFLYKIR